MVVLLPFSAQGETDQKQAGDDGLLLSGDVRICSVLLRRPVTVLSSFNELGGIRLFVRAIFFFKTAQNQILFAKTKLSGCFLQDLFLAERIFFLFFHLVFFKSATNSDFEGFREH